MVEENINQEFRLTNIDEKTNYFVEKIEQNELMSKNPKQVCTTLNHIECFLILVSIVTGCISVSAFASLLVIPIGISSSAVRLKICAKTPGNRKYKSIIKKTRDNVLLDPRQRLFNHLNILIFKKVNFGPKI